MLWEIQDQRRFAKVSNVIEGGAAVAQGDPHPTLPNPPLVEAFFEMRWALEPAPGGGQRDAGYSLAAGRLYDRVRGRGFSHIETLPTAVVPESLVPFIARQRFRVGDGRWPLIQIGPGVATVNFTQPYEWTRFRDTILLLIPELTAAYEGLAPLRPTLTLIRYIDAWPFDYRKQDSIAFLRDFMHTRVELPEDITGAANVAGYPTNVSVSVAVPLRDPALSANLQVATGGHGGNSSIIWDLTLTASDEAAVAALAALPAWLERAHDIASAWFNALTAGELHNQFMEGGAN